VIGSTKNTKDKNKGADFLSWINTSFDKLAHKLDNLNHQKIGFQCLENELMKSTFDDEIAQKMNDGQSTNLSTENFVDGDIGIEVEYFEESEEISKTSEQM